MNPQLWTRDEEQKLRDMLVAGKSFEEAAAVIKRPISGIAWKAKRLGLRDQNRKTRNRQNAKAHPKANRDCMSCQRPFYSEGKHNRLCKYCKTLATVNDFQCEVRIG